jgi:hypothetical protein
MRSARTWGARVYDVVAKDTNFRTTVFGRVLVPAAYAKVSERTNRARRERILFWLQIVGALTGL